MDQERNPVRSFILTHYNDQIRVRSRHEGEYLPTHEPFRLLIGDTVHLVKGCNVYALVLTHQFEPEVNWPKCPHCHTPNWAVWLPVHIGCHNIWNGKENKPETYTKLEWYIICLYCRRIVVRHNYPPYNLPGVTEYVYDPADDVRLVLWPDTAPRQPRRR